MCSTALAPPARPCTAIGYFSRVGQLPLAALCCPPVPSTSLMAPEPRCITGAPLDATEWHAHRALGTTEWHKSQHMRSCQEISHHSTPPSGTHIAHSAPPSGTAEPHRPAARARGGVRAARTTLRRPRPRGCRSDRGRAGRGKSVAGESSAIFDRAAGGGRHNSLREHRWPVREK